MAQGRDEGGLRVAVIGCGGIGRTHVKAYRAIGVRPVALAEPNAKALNAAASEYGGRPYQDYHEMLAAEKLEAVSVCTPPSLHREITEAALAAGVAVLCEKPMAATVVDCEAMAAAAERADRLLMVGFCHRFQPHIERLRKMARRGELGTILMFRNRFAGELAGVENTWFSRRDVAGGGVMLDTCVHSVDLFRYLIGDVERVDAIATTTATPLGPALEVEDSAIIALRAASGVLGVVEASWRTPPGEWTVTLYGTSGTATMDYGTNELRVHMAGDTESRLVDVPAGNRFEREVDHFLRCVQGIATPRITPQDGIAATRILAAAYTSAGAPAAPLAGRSVRPRKRNASNKI